MAADIVPELYEKIHADFERKVNSSKIIKTFQSRLEKKTADAKGVSFYAAELGRCAADALVNNLTEENLPDGKLYWNIAERTMKPLLKECWELVQSSAERMQTARDEEDEISIKPVKAEFPEYRVKDFLDKLVAIGEEAADE